MQAGYNADAGAWLEQGAGEPLTRLGFLGGVRMDLSVRPFPREMEAGPCERLFL